MSTHTDSIAALEKQRAKGIAKYGGVLDDTKPTAIELVEHAIEEAADQLNYLCALRRTLLSQTGPTQQSDTDNVTD